MNRTVILLAALLVGACAPSSTPVRIATYNILDVRTDDLQRDDHPRLERLAATIQALAPDIILINEIAYDQAGVPGYDPAVGAGQNAHRFAERYLAVAQAEGLEGIEYQAFMAPSNTGRASGFDLNGDGRAVTEWPAPPPAQEDGSPSAQTEAGRAYGNDNWGFGTFPGQYAMGLLVREGHEILLDSVRTFQHFRWSRLPDAMRPVDPESGAPWYPDSVWADFPLSSKSHWDVPVRLASGRIIHVLASHPTPPAFDGAEMRNATRNHDEIRFWAAYLDDASFIEDDAGRPGGLRPNASFVIAGDLNADPERGTRAGNPMQDWILGHDRVNAAFTPMADSAGLDAYPDVAPSATSEWGRRIDYVLPSTNLEVLGGGVLRTPSSDHWPVWIDVL